MAGEARWGGEGGLARGGDRSQAGRGGPEERWVGGKPRPETPLRLFQPRSWHLPRFPVRSLGRGEGQFHDKQDPVPRMGNKATHHCKSQPAVHQGRKPVASRVPATAMAILLPDPGDGCNDTHVTLGEMQLGWERTAAFSPLLRLRALKSGIPCAAVT